MQRLSHSDASRHFRPHQFLAREGEVQSHLFLIQEGWAYRYRLLSDGRRQICSLYLPGDNCGVEWLQGQPAPQPVIALTNVRAISRRCSDIEQACEGDSRLRADMWRQMAETMRRQSDWIVNLGRKTAIERLSYLFCDLYHRLAKSGLTYGDQFAMPLTQLDLADITGLTAVHVNRMLQDLRNQGMVELQSKWMRLPDIAALQRLALYPEPSSTTAPAARFARSRDKERPAEAATIWV
ncbi:MAG: Crp/Fnr family transcriptional regulator [Sphingobium sp.]|nr:Crp/Fnr family transcriptional regulator [Sphingobium sp.]